MGPLGANHALVGQHAAERVLHVVDADLSRARVEPFGPSIARNRTGHAAVMGTRGDLAAQQKPDAAFERGANTVPQRDVRRR